MNSIPNSTGKTSTGVRCRPSRDVIDDVCSTFGSHQGARCSIETRSTTPGWVRDLGHESVSTRHDNTVNIDFHSGIVVKLCFRVFIASTSLIYSSYKLETMTTSITVRIGLLSISSPSRPTKLQARHSSLGPLWSWLPFRTVYHCRNTLHAAFPSLQLRSPHLST